MLNHHLKHQGKTTGFPKPELSGVPQGSPAADHVESICLSVYPSTHLSIHQPSRSRSRLIHRYHRRSGQRWLPVSKTSATPRVHPKAILVGCVPTPLKNMKVSWDDYSQYMESHKINVPNHQYWSLKKTSTASVRGSIRKRSSVGWLCQFLGNLYIQTLARKYHRSYCAPTNQTTISWFWFTNWLTNKDQITIMITQTNWLKSIEFNSFRV